jgi:hypothetical protein
LITSDSACPGHGLGLTASLLRGGTAPPGWHLAISPLDATHRHGAAPDGAYVTVDFVVNGVSKTSGEHSIEAPDRHVNAGEQRPGIGIGKKRIKE